MSTTVGENGFHRVTAESLDDSIQGDDITIQYYQHGDSTVIEGATVTGVAEGNTMTFSTNFEDKGIDPGVWAYEFERADGNVDRQIGIDGEDYNRRYVHVTDAVGIS